MLKSDINNTCKSNQHCSNTNFHKVVYLNYEMHSFVRNCLWLAINWQY